MTDKDVHSEHRHFRVNPNTPLIDTDPLSTINSRDLKIIMRDPVSFDLFFHGIKDHFYQEPLIRDINDNICSVFGRQSGKTQTTGQRSVYESFAFENFEVLIVAPAIRQSRELFNRCAFLISRNPILMMEVIKGRLLQSGILIKNGSKITCIPAGETGDTSRGFTPSLLVFEEDSFIPESAHLALEPSLLSTNGIQLRQGTPFGKVNQLYYGFKDSFEVHTIPELRWTSYDLFAKDMIVTKSKDIPEEIAYSTHHYPSLIGLNTPKEEKVLVKEEWDLFYNQSARRYKGWKLIRTDKDKLIGQPFYEKSELKAINDQIDQYITLNLRIGKPQISMRILLMAQRKSWNYYQREYLARFLDEEGTAFPSDWIDQVTHNYEKTMTGISGVKYYAGVDVATGVNEDSTVIIIIAYNHPFARIVFWFETSDRRPIEVERMVVALNKTFNVEKWYIDKNSVGDGFINHLMMDKFIDVEGIAFSTQSKINIATRLETILQAKRIEIPNEPRMVQQFKELQKTKTQSGLMRYSHPEEHGKHDDFVWACGLACLGIPLEDEEDEGSDFDIYEIPRFF